MKGKIITNTFVFFIKLLLSMKCIFRNNFNKLTVNFETNFLATNLIKLYLICKTYNFLKKGTFLTTDFKKIQ